MQTKRSTGGREAVYGVLLIAAMIAFNVLRYPAVLREGGAFRVALPALLLALYAAASWRIGRVPAGAAHAALRQGAGVGLTLAAIMAVHLTVEDFVDLPGSWSAAFSLGLFPVLFLGFGCAGVRGALRTGRWRLGLLAGVWSAMLCIVAVCACGFLINCLFMARLETGLHDSPEFLRSGMRDLKAFTVVNSLESCSSHMIIAPVLALVFGGIGGGVGKVLARRRREPAGRSRPDKTRHWMAGLVVSRP
jgi:hypothetical protein